MATTKWILDSTHSELGFKIKHLMISNVSGAFKSFTAEATTEGTDFSTAKINLRAEMASISTNNDQRDAHLRNSDFFEVEKYPELIFQSTSIQKKADDAFALQGNLTMKGITKPVTLQVEFNGLAKDTWGNEKAGFLVSGKINRNDWGVSFNGILETGALALGEDVRIIAEIQFIKQAVEVPA
ncbi:MAG TPA: YceI family protein [Chitinophagaceae bacterium]|nr:YceI family protein [Chitinophagaceae bacterium]